MTAPIGQGKLGYTWKCRRGVDLRLNCCSSHSAEAPAAQRLNLFINPDLTLTYLGTGLTQVSCSTSISCAAYVHKHAQTHVHH